MPSILKRVVIRHKLRVARSKKIPSLARFLATKEIGERILATGINMELNRSIR